MAIRRLRKRAPSARFVGVYNLPQYDLRFNKVGKDGSGKCNAFYTSFDSDVVEGIVFEIDSKDIGALDNAESYGYTKKNVEVVDFAGEKLKAFTYIGTKINDSLSPFSWYKNHVLIGARTSGLSQGYTEKIKNTKANNDPDKAREHKEFAVHEQ